MTQMFKERNVKQDVMTLHYEDSNEINYVIQPSYNNNSYSHNHLTKNLLEGKAITLEDVDTKERLSIMFTKTLYTNQFENIISEVGTYTIEEL